MTTQRPTGRVLYDNTGRVVLVSGGAMGIGRAICEAWLKSGAFVVCMDVNDEAAAELPDGIEFVYGDTSKEDDCRNAVAFAVESHGTIDVLVNNAAIQPKASYVPVHEMPQDLWDRMVAVNLTGYTLLAKHAIPIQRWRFGTEKNVPQSRATQMILRFFNRRGKKKRITFCCKATVPVGSTWGAGINAGISATSNSEKGKCLLQTRRGNPSVITCRQ